MKRLTLLRHAKSDWDDPVERDFDRPLNRRGEKAALLIGQYARSRKMQFDFLVASPAVRVVQTLDTFLEGYGQPLDPHWDRRIYLASVATLLDVLRDVPDTASNVILAGHNPGLEELILELVPDNDTARYAAMWKSSFRRPASRFWIWMSIVGKIPGRMSHHSSASPARAISIRR